MQKNKSQIITYQNETGKAKIDIIDYLNKIISTQTNQNEYELYLKGVLPKVKSTKDSISILKLIEINKQIQTVDLKKQEYSINYPVDGEDIVRMVRFDPTPTLPKGEGDPPPLEGLGEVKTPKYITANPYTYRTIKIFREELKKNPTKAEKVLWEYLRNKKTGFKIRRQHVIDDFIVDFVCLQQKIIIEVDGKIHDFQKDKDDARTITLNMKGFRVIRFTNEEILLNPQQVTDTIKKVLELTTEVQDSTLDSYLNDLEHEEELGHIYINNTQYFENIPLKVWNFCVGNYQPAKQWLIKRKNKKLSIDEIKHYQNIIIALSETEKLLKNFPALVRVYHSDTANADNWNMNVFLK